MSSSRRGGHAVLEIVPPGNSQPRRGGARFWISAWLPVLIGIAMIAVESTPPFGADRTSGPLRWLWTKLFGPCSDAGWGAIHHLIRKTGHFVGYGGIALAWLRAWWMTLPGSRYVQDAVLALLGTGLLATWDEWHQSFLPNRTSSPWDVLIDCCGGATMCMATYLFVRLFKPQRLTRP